MEKDGEEQLTLQQQDGLARTSHPPERKAGYRVNDPACGPSLTAFLAKYDRDSQCWRTYQISWLESEGDGLDKFSETWPRSGTTLNGIAYQLPPLVRLTKETGSGSLLPTPAASEYGSNQGGAAGRVGKVRPSLQHMARHNQWPTPTVGDSKSAGSRNTENSKAKPGISLTDAVKNDGGTGRTEDGGQLNPEWVEWLMGFPPGWTALED